MKDECHDIGNKPQKRIIVIMTGKTFQQEDDLRGVILKIIGDHHLISAMDIWYELGEDDQLEDGITYEEVNEILLQLKREKMIVRVEDDKWKIKTIVD